MKSKTRIAFMFGAGAEASTANYNLPYGLNFMKETLFAIEDREAILTALERFFSKAYFRRAKQNSDAYTYTKNCFEPYTFIRKMLIYRKAKQDSEFFRKFYFLLEKLMSKDLFKEVKKLHNLAMNDVVTTTYKDGIREEIHSEIEMIFNKKNMKHDDIKSELLKDVFAKDRNGEIMLNYEIGVAGQLDELFHVIINPCKYGKYKFSKVFNYYWICYFTIVRYIIQSQSNKQLFAAYYTNDGNLDYEAILNNIVAFTKQLYASVDLGDNRHSYYHLIQRYLDECKNDYTLSGVCTTNYFKYVRVLESENEPIYLNGKLNLFEFPEKLEINEIDGNDIKDMVVFDNTALFFPFILGQSLVKPIVASKQTEAFHKLKELLDHTDILVVLGFNLNEDDNHINAFFHEFVQKKKNKIMVVVDQSKNGTDKNVHHKLSCDEAAVLYCSVDYGDNEEVIETLFNILKQQLEREYVM